MTTAQELATNIGKRTLDTMKDEELLQAIRNRDVSIFKGTTLSDANFWTKDNALRDEAKKRNLI